MATASTGSFTYWICFSCDAHIRFKTEKAFTDHIKDNHAATIPYDQISLLTDISKRSAPLEITSCPLCDWPEKEGEGAPIDKDTLLDHIAKDLHSFSLRSLPWADSNGQETHERIRYSSDKVYDWLLENELYQSHKSEERLPLEEKIFSSEYFQQNPYFAANSASSSSSNLESFISREEELRNWKQEDANEFKDTNESLDNLDDEIVEWEVETDQSSSGDKLKLKDIMSMDDDQQELRPHARPSLVLAAIAGDMGMVERLFNEGGEIEARDEDGRTSLLWAAQGGKEDIVKFLLERDADLEVKDIDGRTPLLSACHTRMEAVVKLLIEHGADINATDTNGWTPFFWAISQEKEAVAKLLLESGANTETKDRNGWTILYWAAYRGKVDAVEFLLV
ncbi:hypothetical protein MKX08_007489 [Trichoderma sp. CBMAI-0020]|nr:hypothetical protein MKX08_007489 [Trichoderma sp. CBMAI-0020]